MKIGLCGTMSVGKSTLVKELAKLEQFKGYYIATERSKYLRDQGISLNTDSTLKGQFVFAAERSLELMHENLITDRTVYDVAAFTCSAKSIDWTTKRYFCEALLELRDDYDVIIYISPKGMPIEDNGVRETDEKYRETIDTVILNMLEEFKPKKLITVEGSTEERISAILTSLS
jgi:nicotinamide riboside kinase